MRILLGLLGAIAFGTGGAVALIEVVAFRRGESNATALLVAGICALVTLGGLLLMRGAFRGQISVRRPGHRSPLL